MEPSIIREWFVEYADDVHNFLVYFTGSRDVDDFVQDTFLKAMRCFHQYNGTSSPKTWLFTIARSVAIDHIRRQRHSTLVGLGENQILQRSIEMTVELNDFTRQMMFELGKMKAGYREVVIVRMILDMSSTDSAKILGWSVSKVNVTLHRALKELRKKFAIEGGEWNVMEC